MKARIARDPTTSGRVESRSWPRARARCWYRVVAAVCIAAAGLGARAQEASPQARCEDYNPLRNAYFGDLHVHTALSLDAATQDTRSRPADAYRFARGETLGIQPYDENGSALRELRLAQPLDFAAVTDHSELLGEVQLCSTPGSDAYGSWQCRVYRGLPRVAYYLFNSYASVLRRRLGFCGEDGSLCREAARGPWQEVQQAAAEANDDSGRCRFTSFVAYEWTGARGDESGNMHRNVLFATDSVPDLPISFLDAGSPEGLWRALDRECRDGIRGCEALAIPHNSNLSAGYMFDGLREDGSAYTREDALLRARSEPLFEIMQHKGSSECYAGAYAQVGADEYCSFEQLPYDAFGGQNWSWLRKGPSPGTGFFREVLRDGLRMERALGVDPYRMGVIASTDTHLGAAGAVSEAGFAGHGGAGVPARDGVPRGLPDTPEFGPGGLAVVYAEENSRESLFAALKRRETYGTSGTRLKLRFFGGWDFDEGVCETSGLVAQGYARGVPMGGVLDAPGASAKAPRFIVAAQRDPVEGGLLQQIQIIKGWIDRDGASREAVLRVAGDDGRRASVDLDTCKPGGPGHDALCAVWTDPEYRPGQNAWYYARVLENPGCRWSARICARNGVHCDDPSTVGEGLEGCCSAEHRPIQQERAWSSPIWVMSSAQPPATKGEAL